MSDLIDRQALRAAMYHEAMEKFSYDQKWDSGCWIRYKMFERVVDSMPSAQPTLYGYNIEHLELLARLLQKEDLPPERIDEVITDIDRIIAMVKEVFDESLREVTKSWKGEEE